MDISPNSLSQSLRVALIQIETTMDTLKEEAEGMGVEIHEIRHRDGSYPVHALLLAKSNCLLALSNLQTPAKTNRPSPRR